MAKSKHSTALFEVIHNGRGVDRRRHINGLGTPKWWFKSRPKTEPAPVEILASQRPAAAEHVAELPIQSSLAVDDDIAPTSVVAGARTIPVTVAPSGASTVAVAPGSPASSIAPTNLQLDPERHEVTVRLRYTTAIVTGFGILVALGLAYVLGRHIAGGPQSADASPTVEELMAAPPTPAAVEVPRKPGRSTLVAQPTPKLAEPVRRPRDIAPPDDSRPPAAAPAQQRVVNMNYIIAQSYPSEKKAADARDLLLKAGIACSVEKTPEKWAVDKANTWYSVITLVGYQHPHSPEAAAALKAVQVAGEKTPGRGGNSRFDPMFFKWN